MLLQKQFRITTETEPGYWCVRLGSFAIPDLEDIKYKALNDWRMYEFDVIVRMHNPFKNKSVRCSILYIS